MKIATVLPRGMHFSPVGATSIDIVARDLMLASEHRSTSYIVGSEVDFPFADIDFRGCKHTGQRDAAKQYLQVLKADRPDIVVVHQHPESAAFIARHLVDVPVVLHRHGQLKRKRSPLARWFKKRHLKAVSRTIFVSDFIRRSFLDQYPDLAPKTDVVFNGVDVDFWSPADIKQRKFIYVGRARQDKGIWPLVDAFMALHKTERGSDWTLDLILGVQTDAEKALSKELHERYGEHPAIGLFENEPSENVQRHLSTASIAALPSIVKEGFPRAVVEAMACGCGIVATNHGGTPEAAANVATLLENPQAQDFAKRLEASLLELIGDEKSCAEIGRKSREHVIQNLSIKSVSHQYDQVLARTLDGFQLYHNL
ncbi:MAG: glycosyltransferase family 4 protein [Rhodobacteraceae bacterium]|nr:glycosyltransferase family 4 protein [Paracoccaceae bacterium]